MFVVFTVKNETLPVNVCVIATTVRQFAIKKFNETKKYRQTLYDTFLTLVESTNMMQNNYTDSIDISNCKSTQLNLSAHNFSST